MQFSRCGCQQSAKLLGGMHASNWTRRVFGETAAAAAAAGDESYVSGTSAC